MGSMLMSRQSHRGGIGGNASGCSTRWVSALCIASFCLGVAVVNRFWTMPEVDMENKATSVGLYVSRDIHPSIKCEKKLDASEDGDLQSEFSKTHDIIMRLDQTISSLEMQLAAARAAKAKNEEEPIDTNLGHDSSTNRPKVFFVMGIITAFSSRKRRDSIREAWMPQGEDLKKLEKEKGIVIRFVIGHSASPGGVLDRAIDAEEAQCKDFLRLNHVEGYHELSSKTQIYFSTAAAKWDADFYIKVDDDVHVNLGILYSLLSRHQSKPRIYIGCMKSGPVLAQDGVKYQEPEYWKFDVIQIHNKKLVFAKDLSFEETYSIGMQMKMYLLGLGLLVLMLSMLMIEACVVGHPLTVSGRHRLGTLVRHRLIGVAVAYAGQLKECMRFISVVVRVTEQFGTPVIRSAHFVRLHACNICA